MDNEEAIHDSLRVIDADGSAERAKKTVVIMISHDSNAVLIFTRVIFIELKQLLYFSVVEGT